MNEDLKLLEKEINQIFEEPEKPKTPVVKLIAFGAPEIEPVPMPIVAPEFLEATPEGIERLSILNEIMAKEQAVVSELIKPVNGELDRLANIAKTIGSPYHVRYFILLFSWLYLHPSTADQPVNSQVVKAVGELEVKTGKIFPQLRILRDAVHSTWTRYKATKADQSRDPICDTYYATLRNLAASIAGAVRDYRAEMKVKLEEAQRRLQDAFAALDRAKKDIRGAIALRQAEEEAAKKREELERRRAEELKRAEELAAIERAELERRRAIALKEAEIAATEARRILAEAQAQALREVEERAAREREELERRTAEELRRAEEFAAIERERKKLEAILRAAEEREKLAKAEEEEKIRLAEEQRKIAEAELARAKSIASEAEILREEARKKAEAMREEAAKKAIEAAKIVETEARLVAEKQAEAMREEATIRLREAEETARKIREEAQKMIEEAKEKAEIEIKKAEEEARKAALEREEAAREKALAEAEEAAKRLEEEKAKKDLAEAEKETQEVTEVPLTKVAGLPWYKEHWKYLAVGGVGTALTGLAIAIKKKRR